MKAYFINLARRTDRREWMESQFAKLGLDAKRVQAVTPDDISPEQRQASCDPRRYHWMTEVELACSLSHIRAMQTFLDEGRSHGLIFEDDLHLSPRLPAFLKAMHRHLPAVDLLRLETDLKGQRIAPKPDNHVDGIKIIKSWSWSAGAAAYVVSRRAATDIIASPWTRTVQVDRVLFNPYEGFGKSLKMRHCLPGLAVQADRVDHTINDSDLAAGRASREQAVSNRAWRVAKKLRGLLRPISSSVPSACFTPMSVAPESRSCHLQPSRQSTA